MGSLDDEFLALARDVRVLVGLLEEADESFWARMLARSLTQIESRELAGATHVLGCYGGEGTFSDVAIGKCWSESDPLRYRNLNARLNELRTRTFKSANVIASRRSW